MPAAYPLELRQRAIKHYRETDSNQEETAEIFNIGVTTLRIYLRRDEAGELLPKNYKRGQESVISGAKIEQIKSWVHEKPDIQIKKLCSKFKARYKKHVSHSMMCRALRKLNLTRKKKSHFAQEQLRDDVKKNEKLI